MINIEKIWMEMANSIPSSQPFSPTHWVPERCKERQTTLSKDARDRHHPIGSICASVVFDLLPSDTLKMPVNLWDVHPPHGWRSNLKEALLSTDFDEKGITITEQLLTTPLLSVLLHIGYEHVKEVMGRCCYPEARAYVAQKKGLSRRPGDSNQPREKSLLLHQFYLCG